MFSKPVKAKSAFVAVAAATALLYAVLPVSLVSAAHLPDPAQDTASATSENQSIVLAGGCFWGMQDVFQHVKGVKETVVGYTGGDEKTADYEQVSSGTTGHAESVKITYDPSQITLGKILKVYFAVAQDPTELDYQGPDHGTQYRSAVFYATPEQQAIAKSYIAQLQATAIFQKPIVTTVEPLKSFYKAESYHQNYAELHPQNPYIYVNDAPKVENLKKEFPREYIE